MKKKISLFFAMLQISISAKALTVAAEKLIRFETKANAVSNRSDAQMAIPHFEIPLSMLELDFAKRFSPEIVKHLIFNQDGQDMVRWILNPEDTIWLLKVQEHFAKLGLKLEKKYYFTGYQTASRSYIVEDPQKSIQFSVKSSTNKTGGNWASKMQPVGEAIDSRMNADFLAKIQSLKEFKHIIVMDEPAIIKLPAVDQAVVIRDLADLNSTESKSLFVPGFSVLHEEMGRTIAVANGSVDPAAFWTEHYIKPVGRAMGEFAARTGMQFDSPHSQNFLVELDEKLKPTGRIVLRDLADLYIYKSMLRAVHPESVHYLKNFKQQENLLDGIAAGFGPLHGNKFPSWISQAQYTEWSSVFFAEFETTFAKETGLALSDFKKNEGHRSGDYYMNSYKVSGESEAAKQYWRNMSTYKTPQGALTCRQLFGIE